MASAQAGTHFEGLAVAGRHLRRQGVIDQSTKRKFEHVDTVATYLRHVTEPLCDRLLASVKGQLGNTGQQIGKNEAQKSELKEDVMEMTSKIDQASAEQAEVEAKAQLADLADLASKAKEQLQSCVATCEANYGYVSESMAWMSAGSWIDRFEKKDPHEHDVAAKHISITDSDIGTPKASLNKNLGTKTILITFPGIADMSQADLTEDLSC